MPAGHLDYALIFAKPKKREDIEALTVNALVLSSSMYR